MLRTNERSGFNQKGIGYFHTAFNKLSEFKIPHLPQSTVSAREAGWNSPSPARKNSDGCQEYGYRPAECKVGLFPGGGEASVCPAYRYGAIELILKGTLLPAAKALETGIIDRIITSDKDLLTEAKAFLLEIISGKAELKRPVHDFSI